MRRLAVSLTLLTLFAAPCALAQPSNLPWLNQPRAAAPQPAPQVVSRPAPYHAVPAMQDNGPGREADDRRLNELGMQYYHISLKDTKASAKLKALKKKVSAFRRELKHRGYDVADIKKDASKLESRIFSALKKLEAQAAKAAAK